MNAPEGRPGRRPRILYLVTEDWYFVSHRLGLAQAVHDAGCDVAVVTRIQAHGDAIRRQGFRLVSFLLPRSKLSVVSELKSIINLVRVYRQEKPDLVHHVALKPSLYGSLACLFAPVPAVVNALTGLGFAFTAGHWMQRILQPLVRTAGSFLLSRNNSRVILQNPDDFETLKAAGVVRPDKVTLIRGSGVDIRSFPPLPLPDGVPTVAMVSRMLWNKGVGELVEATRRLLARGIEVRTVLVGMPDPENPSSIPAEKLCEWHDEGLVQWWGYRDDVVDVWRQADVAVLPSYREGLPKSLLEAAACGRPIVACDVPGCREIVRPGDNGFLVPAQDAGALAEALEKLLTDPSLRLRMGERSRRLVEEQFHDGIVIRETLKVYESLLGASLGTGAVARSEPLAAAGE
jgi:glycosyltransferase involved in cell wall biosynthesis